MSISPQSHRAEADTSSSTDNCNSSLLREGCARAATYCTVCRSQRRQLAMTHCHYLLSRLSHLKRHKSEIARVVAYCTGRRSRRK